MWSLKWESYQRYTLHTSTISSFLAFPTAIWLATTRISFTNKRVDRNSNFGMTQTYMVFTNICTTKITKTFSWCLELCLTISPLHFFTVEFLFQLNLLVPLSSQHYLITVIVPNYSPYFIWKESLRIMLSSISLFWFSWINIKRYNNKKQKRRKNR